MGRGSSKSIMSENKHWILTPKTKKIKEVSLMEWARWFEVGKNKIIKQEIIKGQHVSTVFMGIDHNFSTHGGTPILFETMIFKGKGKYKDYQDRYSTYKEALEAHSKLVKEIKNNHANKLRT